MKQWSQAEGWDGQEGAVMSQAATAEPAGGCLSIRVLAPQEAMGRFRCNWSSAGAEALSFLSDQRTLWSYEATDKFIHFILAYLFPILWREAQN